MLDTTFDKGDCVSCSYNSGLTNLFGEENPKCLKAECYLRKKEDEQRNKLIQVIQEYPEMDIYYRTSGIPIWLKDYANENNINIILDYNYKLYPEVPEIPKIDDFTDSMGNIDEESFLSENEEYNESMINYQNELEEIDLLINSNKYKKCLVYHTFFSKIEVGYVEIEIKEVIEKEEPTEEEPTEEVDKFHFEIQKINVLNSQDERNKQLAEKSIIDEIKKIILKEEIEDKVLVKEEERLFYSLLAFSIRETREYFFEKNGGFLFSDYFNLFEYMTETDKNLIIREYIKNRIDNMSNSYANDLIMTFSKLHFPTKTERIEEKYNKIYNARKKKIEEEIKKMEEIINQGK